ncbi:hypothetical protein [Blastococcus sp. TF02A-26]|uniref:hypothetical protein n=1 Tax=Blastococcus sp. TF02A-26 TaxID=2250577 RepID=UPI000DE956F9|nr:hypothetical protein [Blastococcus sp. TF02A-26]RBY89740.1 hypothetical protein DQ240_02105 [Blastococcus sp. TF02A-26]
MPDAEDFRALARSSPWLWSTLRFTYRGVRCTDGVRAWLRRPDVLRVETVAGALLHVDRTPPSRPLPVPVFRADGLVARPREYLDRDGDPMFENYTWVAMLDPVELADGQDRELGGPAGPPLEIDGVREVEHGGRPAWEAVVATTDTYEPRCGCCSLLHDPVIDRLEWDDAAERFGDVDYPTASRVRLDAGTGVCVLTEALDGTYAGSGHEVLIEAVDEPMDDTLFVRPSSRGPRRARGAWGEGRSS